MKNLTLLLFALFFIACGTTEDECKTCYEDSWSTKVTTDNPDGELVYIGQRWAEYICGEEMEDYTNRQDSTKYVTNNIGDTIYYWEISFKCD